MPADINSKLTNKQKLFVREYLVDLNATQAAIRAGYKKKCAKEIGCENLSKPHIASAIEIARGKRNARVDVDADYVLKRLVSIDTMDVADILTDGGFIKPIKDWPLLWRQFISGFDLSEITGEDGALVVFKKVKWPDKIKNLELMGKHINVKAFIERKEVKTDLTLNVGEIPPFIADMISR